MDGAMQVSQTQLELANDVLNTMEQGILVWSADGVCQLHNQRIYEILELEPDDIYVGLTRQQFRDRAEKRGEMTAEDRKWSEARIRISKPYAIDRKLPSGRVVLTNARPARGGSYVVTFTDVTEARRAATELAEAKSAAEAARAEAEDILSLERARQTEARLISQLDEWLQSCKSLDELFVIVTRFMERLLPGSKGELYIYSNSRDVLDGMCHWNTHDLHSTIAPDSCWALRRGRTYEYDSKEICFICDHVEDHHHQVTLSEYICVPIVAHGDTVGLLHIRFDGSGVGGVQLHDASQFAVRCGEHISMAIANVKLRDELHDQSIRDPLTGLYNRRYFMDAVRRQISVAERKKLTFGIITFDADNFKMFNDNHGHDAGDMVLRALGAAVLETLGKVAVCARVGGEEFAVLLPDADLPQTLRAAETLREAVASVQVRYLDGCLPQVTISAGVSTYPTCGELPQHLLRRADEALYLAKENGRNCVKSVTNA